MFRNHIRILKQLRSTPASTKLPCHRRLLHLTSIQRSEEQNAKSSSLLERTRKELAEDKKILQWRTPAAERPANWQTKFKYFANEDHNSDFIIMMQAPIDLRPKSIKAWWQRGKENRERFLQQYQPERVQILGVDLAAAHFLLHRGGAVKFVGRPGWMRADEDGNFDLPNKKDDRYKIEALRCDNMNLYYEGLDNLRCLDNLKFLSFHNVKQFDDFCLDRVSGSQYSCLEVLDISGTKVTVNGLFCLYRVPTLKLLIVDDQKQSLKYELMCAVLQDGMPKLQIIDHSVLEGKGEDQNNET